MTKVLLLGGTSEGRELAEALAADGVDAVVSLAGATRSPTPQALPQRVGGFGGDEGFRDWLRREKITAILDATHPFAARISLRTARIAAEENVGYLQVLRPEWVPEAGDRWISARDETEAAEHIGPRDVVFLATGRQTLQRFAGLKAAHIYCRQIDPPEDDFPFPNGSYVIGRPPFSEADERALFQQLGVTWLIVKNAGGTASRSKLDTARSLSLPVLMIERPPQPDAAKVSSVAEALDWVRGL